LPGTHFDNALRGATGSEMFFTMYYVMTGLHATHVTIGVLIGMAFASHGGRFSPSYFTPLELSGLYWHLVDIVWIFLFPLFYLVSRT
jgi:cytochrome c oxidase subunit III